MNYHSFSSIPGVHMEYNQTHFSRNDFKICEELWRNETNCFDYAASEKEEVEIKSPKTRLRQPEIHTLEMFSVQAITLSKLEEFKQDCVPADIRIKERLLRKDVFLDPFIETHIKGQIIQMDLGEDPRCRFPNMDQVAWLVAQDLVNYGAKSREIHAVQGDTFNTDIVTEALLPVYGFDTKQVKFWFDHQRIWRKMLNDEIEEFLMVSRFTKMKMELLGYHSKFWALSDQAMASLNILGYLIYSLNVPIKPLTVRQTEV